MDFKLNIISIHTTEGHGCRPLTTGWSCRRRRASTTAHRCRARNLKETAGQRPPTSGLSGRYTVAGCKGTLGYGSSQGSEENGCLAASRTANSPSGSVASSLTASTGKVGPTGRQRTTSRPSGCTACAAGRPAYVCTYATVHPVWYPKRPVRSRRTTHRVQTPTTTSTSAHSRPTSPLHR